MVGPTRTVDNDEFRDLLRPFTSALSDYAVAMSRHPDGHGHLPAEASIAMRDLAAQQRWGTPEWSEPTRNAHNYGTMLAYVSAEHLAAIAAIIGASRVVCARFPTPPTPRSEPAPPATPTPPGTAGRSPAHRPESP